MELQVTRKTGFYGMGSAISLTKNGQYWFSINHNQVKQLNVSENEMTIQAKLFFFKSKNKIIKNKGNLVSLEITMNPRMVFAYVLFFIFMMFLPIIGFSFIGILVLFALYAVFLFSMVNRAYVIKEK